MGNSFQTPSRDENVPAAWLKSAKQDISSLVNNSLLVNGTAAMLGVGIQAAIQTVLKEKKQNFYGPSFRFGLTSFGIFLGSVVLGNHIVNTYTNTTTNPMRKTENRAAYGFFYVASLSVPVLIFVSFLVPEDYLWESVAVAGSVGVLNAVRCAVSGPPNQVGLQVALENLVPIPQATARRQLAATVLLGDPEALNVLPVNDREVVLNALRGFAGVPVPAPAAVVNQPEADPEDGNENENDNEDLQGIRAPFGGMCSIS